MDVWLGLRAAASLPWAPQQPNAARAWCWELCCPPAACSGWRGVGQGAGDTAHPQPHPWGQLLPARGTSFPLLLHSASQLPWRGVWLHGDRAKPAARSLPSRHKSNPAAWGWVPVTRSCARPQPRSQGPRCPAPWWWLPARPRDDPQGGRRDGGCLSSCSGAR